MTTSAEMIAQARRFHDTGNLDRAEDLYRQILKADPANGEVVYRLGLACHQRDRLDEALAYYRRALRLRPHDPDLVYHLGTACLALRKPEEAEGHFRDALRLRPDSAPARFSLGLALVHQRQLPGAVAEFRHAVRLDPTLKGAHLNLADALQRQGDLPAAAECLRAALHQLPDFPEAHYNLGNVLRLMGREDEAATHFRTALQLRPNFPQAHNNLGSILLTAEKVDAAVEHFAHALRLQPDSVEAHHNMGNALREKQQVTDAIRAYHEALRLQPRYAAAHHSLAEAYLDLGDADPARAHLRLALRDNPAVVRPLLGLAVHGWYTAAEPGVDQLEAWLRDPRLSLDFASHIHFTLGHLLDRAGEPDRAFDHFRRGNAARRALFQQSGTAFDAGKHSRHVDQLIAAFSATHFRRTHGFGFDTELPVFIVGMPRSGTTLVEQILSNHSQVHGGGELKIVTKLVADLSTRLGGAADYPESVARLEATTTHDLATTQLAQLTKLGGPAARVTDKMLENVLHLGVIATLFPKARVIHCRRTPEDVCVSCFLQFFKGLNFSWDLTDLGRYYRDSERLMAHWRAVLPMPIHEVVYEELVTDPEGMSRRLIDFCGLPWEDRCLRFHENGRAVQTMSKVQVRRPVFTTSVGRWQRYAAHLEPLTRALAGAADPPPEGGG